MGVCACAVKRRKDAERENNNEVVIGHASKQLDSSSTASHMIHVQLPLKNRSRFKDKESLLRPVISTWSHAHAFLTAHLHRRKVAVRVLRRHAGHTHLGVRLRWRRCRAVRSSGRARVVLASSPAETDARVANWVALHLVDGHLCSMTLNKLDEPAALARRNLDVCDLAKALEEGTQLILGDVAREASDEDSGVVGVSELVHWLRSGAVVAHGGSTHAVHAHRAAGHTTRHAAGTHTGILVLWGSRGNAHGPVTAVDTLHLGQGALLICLVGEADKAVATRQTADGVGHDLGRLAGREASLEDAHKHVLVDLGAEIANKDGEFRATVVTAAVGKATAGSPVELEGAVRVGDQRSIQGESLLSCVRALKINETISSITSGPRISCFQFLLSWLGGGDGVTYPENLSRIILTLT